MLVSFNWLKEFVPVSVSVHELCEMLTLSGLEIESVEEMTPDFQNVLVGKILKISPHPNADKLVLCEVDAGKPSPLRIVCGASNMQEGDKVPLAVVGAELSEGLKVKKAKIRGETSEGMMCSERELGISDDHSGIMILSPDTEVGAAVDEILGLNDTVLELGITPNRPDCLSMLGIAREVAAITHTALRPPKVSLRETGADVTSLTSITIDDEIGCPRYAARIVSGVTIGPSPAWMAQRLVKAGLRPLNNVVDVTNYVLMELGHPLHAFDYERLGENRIVVRRARNGESIISLDGSERTLTQDMLVIADAQNPVAIAGIMGGANSEVTELTKTVLIESAYFDPVSIRRTSKALGLSTEASYRFERGADIEMVTLALDRAAALMAELSGGEIAHDRIDQYPRKMNPREVTLRFQRIKRILGIEVPADQVVSILTSLGLEIVSREKDAVRVKAPSYRPDIQAEIDLIEEVARMYGYDRIDASYPQDTALTKRGIQPPSREDCSREVLKSSGFSEIITFSFGSQVDMEEFRSDRDDAPSSAVRMKNPLAEDASTLRTTLIPGLLKSIQSNVKMGSKNLKLFEVGRVYHPAEGEVLPEEPTFLSAAATGLSRQINWKGRSPEIDFFDVKGVAEMVLTSLGCREIEMKKASFPGFHPGACAELLVNGKSIGTVGEIHPALLEKFDIGQRVCAFELNLSILETDLGAARAYEKLSRFPCSDRDLAVVVDEQVEAASLNKEITAAGGEILKNVLLFDTYRGEQVGESKKSLAFSLRFQSDERTLTDDEISAATKAIVERLESRFGAKLRT